MPKIETPEAFGEKLSDRQHTAPYIASLIAARDAAIRAESAELLRVCGEKIGQELREVKAIETYDAACTLTEALAALKDAGVQV